MNSLPKTMRWVALSVLAVCSALYAYEVPTYIVSIAPRPPLAPGVIQFAGCAVLKCITASNGMPYMEILLQNMETNGSICTFATSGHTTVNGDRSSSWRMVVADNTNAVISAMYRFGNDRYEVRALGRCSVTNGEYYLFFDQPIPKEEQYWTATALLDASPNAWLVTTNTPLNDTNLLGGQKNVFKGLINSRSSKQTEPGVVEDTDFSSPLPGSAGYAVVSALEWLKSCQNKDGSWGNGADTIRAETGLALLAFLGYGETMASVEYGKTIVAAFRFLLADMQATNRVSQMGQASGIGHAIATWALCEGYEMMSLPALKSPTAEALAVIVKGQRASGLWDGGYSQREGEDDIEASIWQVVALTSGLEMDPKEEGVRECRERASRAMEKFLEARPDSEATAGLVWCLQLSGKTNTTTFKTALASLETVVPDWEKPAYKDPLYRWLFTTQALWQKGEKSWIRWNRLNTPMLVKRQKTIRDKGGKTLGYWDSPGSGERGGQVYSTALSVIMQEVYYRFFPIFHKRQSDNETSSTNDVVIKIE